MSKVILEKNTETGDLQYRYSPLQNLITDELGGFKTNKLQYNFNNNLNIDLQTSYDDSINLILNDGYEIPRIINSQFRKLENEKYEYINRNQGLATNIYNNDTLSQETNLFLMSLVWPKINLNKVSDGGNLIGGNYTFYIKYCDEDFNESDIVSESGIISVFNGSSWEDISGTIMEERTNKLIELEISNFDQSFGKFYLYYSLETCDINGINITRLYKIRAPYEIEEVKMCTINGYENVDEVDITELNISYNYYNKCKTQAIVQNMLFLGNVGVVEKNYYKLQQASYKIKTSVLQHDTSIGYVDITKQNSNTQEMSEYFNPNNLYNWLGYWPNEFYQLGICYILNDGTTTPVFTLYGGKITNINEIYGIIESDDVSLLEHNKILDNKSLKNTAGIFKTPNIYPIIYDNGQWNIKPLYFQFTFPEDCLEDLKKLNVVGYFFVRAKRIPKSLFQGMMLGVTDDGLILPSILENNKHTYIAESFDTTISESKDPVTKQIAWGRVNTFSLISLDANLISDLQGILTWNEFKLTPIKQDYYKLNNRHIYVDSINNNFNISDLQTKLVYINNGIKSVYLNSKYFTTRIGNPDSTTDVLIDADALYRGEYLPIIGTSLNRPDSKEDFGRNELYTIELIHNDSDWISSLLTNNEYHAISERENINNYTKPIDVYRGDCFINTVTMRLNWNFIDPSFPANNSVIDNSTTIIDGDKINEKINVGDLNAKPLGLWISYKCLSNYNTNLRSIDRRDSETASKLGTDGAYFYPLSNFNTSSSGKLPESSLLNRGYNTTLSKKTYNRWVPTPYENWNYENRIAFSNIASTKMFTNGFRVFQGLSYTDVDKSYGAIVKLFAYDQNLLCIFEHGIAIIPVKEKALLSTQEGQSIHLYGSGILQEQVSVISPDYGSTHQESLIKTPLGFYGVDISAKKIWKYNKEGFQCISDCTVQSFVNEQLSAPINEYFFGVNNVRTHYNNFKGDVIFTFSTEIGEKSICYNERLNRWTSRYSWVPLLSSNIDNIFYSFDLNSAKNYLKKYMVVKKDKGIICENPIYLEEGIKLQYVDLDSNDVTLEIGDVTINNKKYEVYHGDCSMITVDGKDIGIYYHNLTDLNNSYEFEHGIAVMFDNKIYPNAMCTYEGNWYYYIYNQQQITTSKIEECEFELVDLDSSHLYVPIINIVVENEYLTGTFFNSFIDNNKTLHICNPILSDTGIINVVVKAYDSKRNELENIELSIHANTDFTATLYKHDIDSPLCNWYGTQHAFEYEFVINTPIGLQKIINNLSIISNNAEPESIEINIIGDVYEFKELLGNNYSFPIININENKCYYTTIKENNISKEKHLIIHQDLINIKDFGRRLGNMSYVEGKWEIVLQPIYYVQKENNKKILKNTRLRDKWAKIRIKYSGEKLVIINAIQTLMNISYV